MKTVIWTIIYFILFCVNSTIIVAVGELIVTGFDGVSPVQPSVKLLKKRIDANDIGGIILYQRNIRDFNQLQELIQYLTKDTSIIIAIDHEGGLVNRLTHNTFGIPLLSPELFCQQPIFKQKAYAKQSAQLLVELGINVNFGGVLDLKPLVGESSVCNDKRCFSDQVDDMIQCFNILHEAHQNAGVHFVLKHFPGHGSTPIDSHLSLPNITNWHSDEELTPYWRVLNNGGGGFVMMGHLMDTRVDDQWPASLSSKHISVLNQSLTFDGVIITDDLQMGALSHVVPSLAQRAGRALQAGNHLILFEKLNAAELAAIHGELNKQMSDSLIFKRFVDLAINKRNFLLKKAMH